MKTKEDFGKLEKLNIEIIVATNKLRELKEQRQWISKKYNPWVYEKELERLNNGNEL